MIDADLIPNLVKLRLKLNQIALEKVVSHHKEEGQIYDPDKQEHYDYQVVKGLSLSGIDQHSQAKGGCANGGGDSVDVIEPVAGVRVVFDREAAINENY